MVQEESWYQLGLTHRAYQAVISITSHHLVHVQITYSAARLKNHGGTLYLAASTSPLALPRNSSTGIIAQDTALDKAATAAKKNCPFMFDQSQPRLRRTVEGREMKKNTQHDQAMEKKNSRSRAQIPVTYQHIHRSKGRTGMPVWGRLPSGMRLHGSSVARSASKLERAQQGCTLQSENMTLIEYVITLCGLCRLFSGQYSNRLHGVITMLKLCFDITRLGAWHGWHHGSETTIPGCILQSYPSIEPASYTN